MIREENVQVNGTNISMMNLDTDFWKFPLPCIEREKKYLSKDSSFQVYYQGSRASLQSTASHLSGGLLVCIVGVHCWCALWACTASHPIRRPDVVHCWCVLLVFTVCVHYLSPYKEACWCALLAYTAGVCCWCLLV